MTFASDQKPGPEGLSDTSRRMLALRGAVFAEWEKRVRAALDKAASLARPLLIDSLPVFYDNIAEAVSPGYPRRTGTDGTTLAAGHGSERACATAYDYEALVGEYQAFRWAIFDVLYQHGLALGPQEVMTINTSIDAGIQESVAAFALAHSGLREQFAAALTHDLRAPLGAAAMALELIASLDDPAQMREAAGKALASVQRMDGMVRDLLDTMAFHGGDHAPLDLAGFDIADVVREVRADLPPAARSRVHCSGPSVHGWWDRQALKRALENLVANALKYGDDHTPVTIGTDATEGRLFLSVHNAGHPIDPDEQRSIFAMYRRARSAASLRQQGWGIGLPYVRTVAERHGGSVTLDSTAERGTTFTVDIPADCRPHDYVSGVA